MANINVEAMSNIEAMCRVCMELHGSCEPLKWETDLLEKFVFVSSLQVEPVDKLPKSLCNACTHLTEEFYKFKIKCAESDLKFRALTVEPKVEEPAGILDGNCYDDGNMDLIKIVARKGNAGEKISDKDLESERIKEGIKMEKCTVETSSDEDKSLASIRTESKIQRLLKTKNSSTKGRRRKEEQPNKQTSSWTCQPCGKKFFAIHKYQGHMREHQGLKPAVCEDCGKEFDRFKQLYHHVSKWHKNINRTYPCSFDGCDKIFKSRPGLRLHINAMHSSDGRLMFVCETCGKAVSTKQTLMEHQRCHTGEKPYKCDQCPKAFSNGYGLKIHIMRHNNIRNFVCPICDMRKTTQKELKTHLGNHSRAYEVQCEHCKKLFGTPANLMNHIAVVHNGEKKYICSYCDRAFGKNQYLKNHVMIHTGEKPHACEICPKRFIQPIALQKHLKTHAESKQKTKKRN